MGPKKRLTAAERQQRSTKATAKKRPASGSAHNSPAARKINTATPKKNLARIPSPAKRQQSGKEKEKDKEKEKAKNKDKDKDKERDKPVEADNKTKRTPSRDNVKKCAAEVKEKSAETEKAESSNSNKVKHEQRAAERQDEKTKAISKMLKSLDIQISGFDNILPKEERMSEDLKSSISENVKTKSRAAAVKVIASLNPPKSNTARAKARLEEEKREKLLLAQKEAEAAKAESESQAMKECKVTKESTVSKTESQKEVEKESHITEVEREKEIEKVNANANAKELVKAKETEVTVESKKKMAGKKSNQKQKKPAQKTKEEESKTKKTEEPTTKAEMETPTKKKATKAKPTKRPADDKPAESANENDKLTEPAAEAPLAEQEGAVVETLEPSDKEREKPKEKVEKSPRKTPTPKRARSNPKNADKCNTNTNVENVEEKEKGTEKEKEKEKDADRDRETLVKELEEKEETLKVVLDANTEVVQMDIEEMPERVEKTQKDEQEKSDAAKAALKQKQLETVAQQETEEKDCEDTEQRSTVSLESGEKPEDERKPMSNIKQRLQSKYKVTPVKTSAPKAMVKKVTKEIALKAKADKSSTSAMATNDIYDFKSGSEEEENIKMDLPTLKNLREFSDEDNKPLKMAKGAPKGKAKEIVEVAKSLKKSEEKVKENNKDEQKEVGKADGAVEKEGEEIKKAQQQQKESEEEDDKQTVVQTAKKAVKPKVVRKVYSKKPAIVKKALKTVKAKIIKKSIKPKPKPKQKTVERSTSAESSDSEDEKKLIIFGQKRHRMASLNALAKVQCLYENESRTAYELGLSKATQLPPKIRTVDGSDDERDKDKDKEKDAAEEKLKVKKENKNDDNAKVEDSQKEESEEEPEVETKRELRNVPGGRGLGKHWEFDSDSGSNDELEKLKAKKKKLQKKLQAKKERDAEKQREKEKKDAKQDNNKDESKAEKCKDLAKAKDSLKVKRKYTKIKKPLKKLIKLKAETSEAEANSEQSDLDEDDKPKQSDKEKGKVQKAKLEARKPPKKRKRMLREELIGDYKGILARKRMASLNASAIVAATYEVERHLDKNLAYDCSSYESSDEEAKPNAAPAKKSKETKSSTTAKDAKKASSNAEENASNIANATATNATATATATANANASAKETKPSNVNEESNDSKYSKETKETNTDTTTTAGFRDSGSTKDAKESSRPTSSSVVIVQDTDVTITGVYVNATTGSSQEAYCKMQYRVQSSVTEERVLRPNSVEPPKSYTPLSALSSMLPPGATAGAGGIMGEAHTSPPPPPNIVGDPLSAGIYHASDLGLHTEHGAPDHGPPPPSYAAAAAAAAAAYHAHHMSPAAAAAGMHAHHQHQYAHSHPHQYQPVNEHGMHAHGGPPPPPPPTHHYQAPPHYGPPPPASLVPPPAAVQGRCDVVSPPPTYRSSIYAPPPQQVGPPTMSGQQPSGLLPPAHSSLSMTAGSGASAFCAPNIHHHQQQQQQQHQQQQQQQLQQHQHHQQQQQQAQQQQQQAMQQHDTSAPSLDAIYQLITRSLPAMPWEFSRRHINARLQWNETCAPYPNLLTLQFHNDYWQLYTRENLTFYLFGAYYDMRPIVTKQPLVRLLAMVNQVDNPYPPSYCQLWFNERTAPSIVPVQQHQAIWYPEWGGWPVFFYPTLITCAVPDEVKTLVPQTVSLVDKACATARNNLRVIYEPLPANESKSDFSVCVKALSFAHVDLSARMVEWMELLRLLGAKKVTFYDLGVHPNMSKVLRYYERKGWLEAPRITLARGEPWLPDLNALILKLDPLNDRLNEVLQLNDCLYRNMYKYEYIAIHDIDEVIMPLGERKSWPDIIDVAKQVSVKENKLFAAFCILNVYYPHYAERPPYKAEVPTYMYMLQHVARVEKHLSPGEATKCFHSTSVVFGVHNHFPMHYPQDYERFYALNESVAQLQHYREPDAKETLKNPVIDDNIWRFAEPLLERTQSVLRELGFFRKIARKKWAV